MWREGEQKGGKGDPNIYRSIRAQAQQEGAGLLCWGQCLGKDSLRRGHFSEVWVGEEYFDRQGRKGKGIPGKARTPSSLCFQSRVTCMFGENRGEAGKLACGQRASMEGLLYQAEDYTLSLTALEVL